MRYSLTKYSLRPLTEIDIEEKLYAIETIKAKIGVGKNLEESFQGIEQLKSKIGLALLVSTRLDVQCNLKSNINLFAIRNESLNAQESIGSKAYFGKDVSENLTSECSIKSKIKFGANFYNTLEASERIFSTAFFGLDIYANIDAVELLMAEISTAILGELVTELDVSLLPGDELIIDSDPDVMTMTINGQNAIHLHNGDWINIYRETIRLLIESAQGNNLSGEMIYTERFL